MVSGIVTFVIEAQFINACAPIFVTLNPLYSLGIVKAPTISLVPFETEYSVPLFIGVKFKSTLDINIGTLNEISLTGLFGLFKDRAITIFFF